MNFFKKYKQSIAFTATLVILALTAVLGFSFSEYAKTKFWWTFWDIAAGVSGFIFVGLIIWAVTKRKKFDE